MSVLDPNATDQPQMKEVGRGLNAGLYSPDDPQWHLAGSNHPYTPFPGNALKWQSSVFDDGTTYEGLMRENIPHMKGTLVVGSGSGGGFQTPDEGDIYEGEFEAGYAHGLGQYIGAKGEIYRGEFKKGQRNGCGVLVNMRPYLRRVQKGDSPEDAWEATKEKINTTYTKAGTWQGDLFLTGPSEDASFCHMAEIQGVLEELNSVITRTRMFRHKPDGEVTLKNSFQDSRGIPITVYQDPMHYPHGTGFLAPGPMGQTHPIPDDPQLKASMAKAARNHMRIWEMYNLPRESEPGSAMAKAEELGRQEEEARKKAAAEMMAAEKRRLRRLERLKAAGEAAQKEAAAAAAGADGADGEGGDEDDAGGVDDEDLTVASVPVGAAAPSGRPGFGGPTAFASIGLSMNRASHIMSNAISRASARASRMPRIVRPEHLF